MEVSLNKKRFFFVSPVALLLWILSENTYWPEIQFVVHRQRKVIQFDKSKSYKSLNMAVRRECSSSVCSQKHFQNVYSIFTVNVVFFHPQCQQDLSIFSGESSSSSTPRHEATKSESLLPVDPSKSSEDSNLLRSPKASGDDDAGSVMVMKDVTKRRSFGNNLLASLEERLAFDQAVSDANEQKKDEKEYQHIGQIGAKYVHAGESESKSKPSTPQESRRKTSEHGYKKKVSKPKMAPPGPGPKPRDIPKYTDPPMYHKSQSQNNPPQSQFNPPKYNEPPRYLPDVEPPSQTIDRGRPTVEPPKQPKVSKPKMEPPKPKVEKPKVQPPPPKQSGRPTMAPPEPTRQNSEKSVASASRRQMSPREVDKEKLLPQTVPKAAASEGIPTSTSHDNLSLEDDDDKDEKVSIRC